MSDRATAGVEIQYVDGHALPVGPSESGVKPAEARRGLPGSYNRFDDSLSVTVPDPDHSVAEERFLLLGLSNRRRLLVVAHSEQSESIRIISARRANRRERRIYEEEES
jgi:uncharacterized DUF497 family protein